MTRHIQMLLFVAWTGVLATVTVSAGCDLTTGVPAELQSGPLLAQIDAVGPENVDNGVLTKMNPVSSGADSRWTQYVTGVGTFCGGVAPGGMAFENVDLKLGDGGTVTGLEQVFDGPVAIQLEDNSTGRVVNIATRGAVFGAGLNDFNVTGNVRALAPILPALLRGDFSVGLSGSTSLSGDFDVSFRVGVRVRAYCTVSEPETDSTDAPPSFEVTIP